MVSLLAGYAAFFLLPVFLAPSAIYAPSRVLPLLFLGLLDISVFIFYSTLIIILWFSQIKTQYTAVIADIRPKIVLYSSLLALSLYTAFSALTPQYIDLTNEQVHSIRPFTKKMLSLLDSECLITWYRSDQLTETPSSKSISYLLSSYVSENPKRCIVVIRDPTAQNTPEFPERVGLLPLESGWYSGIRIEYRGEHHLIPSTADYSLLEYEMTKALENLILYQNSKINPIQMMVLGNPTGYDYLQKILEHAGFTLIPPENPEITLNPDIPLIIIGSEYCTLGSAFAIETFLDTGGSAVFFVSGTTVDTMGTWSAQIKKDDYIINILERRGIAIKSQLILDDQSFRIVMPALEGESVTSVSYPYWITVNRSGFYKNHSIFSGISSLQFFWPSPLVPLSGKMDSLIQTSKRSYLVNPPFFTHPFAEKSHTSISEQGTHSLASFLESPGRTLIITDEYCISQLIDYSASYDNLLFFINCVEWISGNEDLTSIKRRPL